MSKWNRQIRTDIHLLTIRGKINMSDIKRSSTLVSKWFNEKCNASLHCQMMELVLLNGKWFYVVLNDSTQSQLVQRQIDRFSMKATHSRKRHGIASVVLNCSTAEGMVYCNVKWLNEIRHDLAWQKPKLNFARTTAKTLKWTSQYWNGSVDVGSHLEIWRQYDFHTDSAARNCQNEGFKNFSDQILKCAHQRYTISKI